MKLATSTGDFDRFCGSYLERIKHVQEAGFTCIDLSLYTPIANDPLLLADDWQKTAKEMLDYANQNGLEFVQCHSPNTNPLDEAQFEKAVALNIRSIEICGMLGIPTMIVHSGWDRNATKEEWFAKNKAFFEKLLPTAEKHNVCICHENTASVNIPGVYPKKGSDMIEFSKFVNHPLFHSCWDTGHANIEGPQYDEIMTIGDDLRAIHFNDNRGKQDEHLIPYLGTLNVDEVMCALRDINFKGPLTFEAGSCLRPSKYWLGSRNEFDREAKLVNPTLELQKELEKFMFKVGQHVLSAYDK